MMIISSISPSRSSKLMLKYEKSSSFLKKKYQNRPYYNLFSRGIIVKNVGRNHATSKLNI
jgi:hypothetical protein